MTDRLVLEIRTSQSKCKKIQQIMDIYKFNLTLKEEDYEVLINVDSIYSKRKKNIQTKGYD